MNLAATQPSASTDGTTDDIQHLVCCDPNTALCGLDVTDLGWTDMPEQNDCPLCVVVDDTNTYCTHPACPGVE